MLTKRDYLAILLKEPEEEIFYYDRPVIYTVTHKGSHFLISLMEDSQQVERFLVVECSEATYALLEARSLTPREFFLHPENVSHTVVIEFPENDNPVILSGEQYDENSVIPETDLPTVESSWLPH